MASRDSTTSDSLLQQRAERHYNKHRHGQQASLWWKHWCENNTTVTFYTNLKSSAPSLWGWIHYIRPNLFPPYDMCHSSVSSSSRLHTGNWSCRLEAISPKISQKWFTLSQGEIQNLCLSNSGLLTAMYVIGGYVTFRRDKISLNHRNLFSLISDQPSHLIKFYKASDSKVSEQTERAECPQWSSPAVATIRLIMSLCSLTYRLSSGRLQRTAEPDEPSSSTAPSTTCSSPDREKRKTCHTHTQS